MARLSLGVLSASAGAVLAASAPETNLEAFEQFKRDFNRNYTSEEEHAARLKIFERNAAFIEQENEKGHSYWLGLNNLADISHHEYVERLGFVQRPETYRQKVAGKHESGAAALADEVDWRGKAVTKVKDQGQCGSCWAFSVTGALEGAWAVATGKLIEVSEQQLVDCSGNEGNEGCNGGEMDAGFEFEEHTGVCTEDSYAYTATDGTCHSSCTVGIPSGAVTSFVDVQHKTSALMSAISQQPVAVAIDANSFMFQLYRGGIFTHCGHDLDHGVLAVGYGGKGEDLYWIVKNSWGAGWGENGYIRISRKTDDTDQKGTCGILMDASYPVVRSTENLMTI